MKSKMHDLGLVFSAGALGGFANALAVWFFGFIGLTALVGVNIAPPLAPPFVYAKIVWGGIWGLLLLLPFLNERLPLKGFILSLGPTLVQLLIVFPLRDNKEIMGLALGTLTPLCVVFYNYIWGLVAVYCYRACMECCKN